MPANSGSRTAHQPSIADIAAEAGRSIERIKKGMEEVRRKAEAFEKTCLRLWKIDYVRADPIATRLILRIRQARTPARLRFFGEALCARVAKLREQHKDRAAEYRAIIDPPKSAARAARAARTPGMLAPADTASLYAETEQRRMFLML